MDKTIDFTRGKIIKPLMLFAVPIFFAMFLQALYGAVDLWVVGQFATEADVSGVAVGSQFMNTVTNVVVSFAMGSTIYLAQKIGEGDNEKSGEIVGTTIVMFAILGCILSFVIPIFSGEFAKFLNAPDESFSETKNYIMICGAGSVMIVAYNVIGAIFRGVGDSNTPLLTVAIAAIINIFGDIILVRDFKMGSEGAAIATVLSQTISVLVSMFILRRRKLPFKFGREKIGIDRSIAKKITKFGIPIAAQDFLVSFSFLMIMSIVNGLGVVASAGVGIAEKVCAFIMLVPSAFMQSMSSFVAQNKGAKKLDRALKGVRAAIGVSGVLGIFMFYISFFHGDFLCRIFSEEGDVVYAACEYLRAYGIDCLLTCLLFCLIGFYNGLGLTRFVMIQGIFSAFFIRIPVAFFMSKKFGTLFSIGLAIPISTVVQIVMCISFYFYMKRNREFFV